MNKLQTYDLFFSYAHSDGHIAKELAALLLAQGLTCFMSARDIHVGDLWNPSIRDAIRCSDRVLLLITPRSKDSAWVTLEIGAAWMQEKEFIPLTLFVDAKELRDIAKDFQGRPIETDEQKREVVNSLAESRPEPQLSFRVMLSQIERSLAEMRARNVHPQTVLCVGRAGAICGGIMSHFLNTFDLTFVTLRTTVKGEDRMHEIKSAHLKKEDIENRQVLVVEWERDTGRTFRSIEEHLRAMAPASVNSFALFWTGKNPNSKPDFYGFQRESLPIMPWEISKPKRRSVDR
jgi:hypoxanthine phosphoribosyltransferase